MLLPLEPSQGSLFRVYLPVLVCTQNARAAKIPSFAEMRGTETILLAEDHESIREMARQTLVSLGYRVLSVGDGEEALRLCEQETPALAILDVVMPKLGGPATAAKLVERGAAVRVLLTSGYTAGSECLPTGATHQHYLQKPYSPTTLARLVREILDESPTLPPER